MSAELPYLDCPLYNIDDTCQKLGKLGRTQVYYLIKKGELEVVRIGGPTMISAESIRRVIERGRAGLLRKALNPPPKVGKIDLAELDLLGEVVER